MKRFILTLLALIILATAIPVVSLAEEQDTSFIEAIGELDSAKFLGKYALSGSVVPASGNFVGTGSTLTKDDKDYTVIVRGDINGDGRIQSVDYLKVKKYFAGQTLSSLEAIAADVNCDNDIKSVDYLKIKSYLKGGELWSADAYVGERYMGFRIWNFTVASLDSIKSIADKCKAYGFNMINLHMPWYRIEATEGNYDYSKFDDMIEYINGIGLKVCAILYLARLDGDGYLNEEDYCRNQYGNKSGGDEARKSFSFSSPNATDKAITFYKNAVAHFDEKFGTGIVMYLPCTSHYCEMEYCVDQAQYDYCDFAVNAFRAFLREKYSTIENMNAALGTNYASFEAAKAPATGVSDYELVWLQFKQKEMKAFTDRLCDATHEVNPNAKICIQVGSATNSAINQRGIASVATLCEKADIVWIDDGPGDGHNYNLEYLRCAFGKKIELGDEIDGPAQVNASEELYLRQGRLSYGSGAKYVVCANWMEPNHMGWGGIWTTLRDEWLGEGPHEVTEIPTSTVPFEMSVYDLLGATGGVLGTFRQSPINMKIEDDFSERMIDRKNPKISYLSNYSNAQGGNGWNYYAINKNNEVNMTMQANRWSFNEAYMMKNILFPSTRNAVEACYNSSVDGDVDIRFTAIVQSPDSNGVGIKIMVNDTQIYPTEGEHAIIGTNGLADSIPYTIAKGDKVKFIFDANGDHANDCTIANMFVDLK